MVAFVLIFLLSSCRVLQKKKKLAEELAKKKKRLEREAAKKIQALPKMASFEDYQKKKQEKKSTKHPLTSTAAAADMIPPAPASGTGTSTGAGTGTGTGKASTSLSSGPTSASIIAQSSSSDEELQVVIRFVKKHLVPLVESGSLSKHDYKSIKDKVVKKVAEGNKAKGWTMDAEFFSTRSEKGKEQADKVVKLIEGYVAAASASASAAGGRSLREKSKK